MAIRLEPYLNFRDTTRQVMEFYRSVFGGEVSFDEFKKFSVSEDPAEDDKIMHSNLVTSTGMTLMAADTPNRMPLRPGSNFALSLSGPHEDEAELRKYFDLLSEGGQVTMPLNSAPWGDTFGMLTDKFGIDWMVNIAGKR